MSEFTLDDPRVKVVAQALLDGYYEQDSIGIGPVSASNLAIRALTALRDHYETTLIPRLYIVLRDPGMKKIQVIKEVRYATNLGLKEAKDFVEGKMPADLPTYWEEGALPSAEYTLDLLRAAGATCDLEKRMVSRNG